MTRTSHDALPTRSPSVKNGKAIGCCTADKQKDEESACQQKCLWMHHRAIAEYPRFELCGLFFSNSIWTAWAAKISDSGTDMPNTLNTTVCASHSIELRRCPSCRPRTCAAALTNSRDSTGAAAAFHYNQYLVSTWLSTCDLLGLLIPPWDDHHHQCSHRGSKKANHACNISDLHK